MMHICHIYKTKRKAVKAAAQFLKATPQATKLTTFAVETPEARHHFLSHDTNPDVIRGHNISAVYFNEGRNLSAPIVQQVLTQIREEK